MDVQPPRDASLRNIIDKLAEFVARNGPEFEAITKQKQQNNPKFEFLYGGEFATYYQFRVAAEQQMLKQQGGMHAGPMYMQQPPPSHVHYAQQQQQQSQQVPPTQDNMQQAPQQQHQSQHMWPNPNANPAPPSPSQSSQAANGTALAMNLNNQLDAIKMQQNTLREQIKQSDANLSAQHTALMTQKTKQIDDAMTAAQTAQLEQLANEQGIVLREFDGVLQPIIESCTKDSISAGKNWILQHSTDSAKINVVLQYLLKKALVNGSTFQQKLHLIYLVNDILHHCMRKNINDLKNNLENVVIPMFCSADLIANNDQRQKLSKLLSLWESKAKFFDACVISKLQSPDSSMQEYKTNVQNTHLDIVTKYTQSTKATLDNYQKQHQIFMQHATQQIAQLEQQKLQLEKQLLVAQKPQHLASPGAPGSKSIPALMSQRIAMPGVDKEHMNTPPPPATHDPHQQQPVGNMYPGYQQQQQQQQQKQQPQHFVDPRGPNFFIPDMSKPPPGFPAPPMHGQVAPQQQQQPPQQQTPQYPQVPGGDTIVDMGVLNAAIQAVMHLQHQQQHQQQHEQAVPQQQQQLQQQQQQLQLQHQQQQVQQQPPPFAQIPINSLGQVNDGSVDLGALNAAINVVLQQRPDEVHPGEQLDDNKRRDLENPEMPSMPMTIPIQEPQVPTAPYYDLPAGLIVPLIRLEDYNYKSLDSTDIRLPAPAPQSDRLTNALNAFYAAPSHDRPRDNEGWEKLGLYEYYKVKNAARKQKEEEIKNGTRNKSRSPSPIILEKTKKSNKRCYRSKSRSRSRSRTPVNRNRSRSRSKSRSAERVLTPPPQRNRAGGGGGGVGTPGGANSGGGGAGGGSNRKARNRSPRHERDMMNNSRENRAERNNSSNSNSNNNNSSNNNNNNGNNNVNNSRRVDRDRSPTPPSFFGSSFAKPQEFIEETNKGHQMLMKMGWAGTGTGLGSKNQGIDTPISGGEVRDRKDMYKGVGNNLNDPFERFRKNKGAAFAHRMSTRDYKA